MHSETLKQVYALIAELWCSPAEQEQESVSEQAPAVLTALTAVDTEGAEALAQFLANPVPEEEYVALFELDPLCPLYLGSHVFEEPKTCAQAAVSDRNSYMLELIGIYRHFGMVPNGKELPDYLPLMVEFLALTAGSSDPLRARFIQEYLLPFLEPIRERLAELNSPYLHLLKVLERVLAYDLQTNATEVTAHV